MTNLFELFKLWYKCTCIVQKMSKKAQKWTIIWKYCSFLFTFIFDYVNKLVDRFDYKLEDTKDKMEQMRNKENNFISNL